MTYPATNLVSLDFETTGLSPASSEVLEFALVRIRESKLDLELTSLCRPLGSIGYGAYCVHGIGLNMVQNETTFAEWLPSVLGFIGSDIVVCHNVPFDMSFLRSYCAKAGLPCPSQTIDTLQMARRALPQLRSKSLGCVCEHLGINNVKAHRALGDARAAAEVYLKLRSSLQDGG